jgi:hypothetical protein
MRCIAAYLLNDDQKQNRLSVCNDMQDKAKEDGNFLLIPVPKDENAVKGRRLEDIVKMQRELLVVVDGITK